MRECAPRRIVEIPRIDSLPDRYYPPPDAHRARQDACLVRMSELHSMARVFTLDADFRLYRRNGRQTIPLIYPAP